MGGDDSQKLLPWRGSYSPPGRGKPPAHLQNQHSSSENHLPLSGIQGRNANGPCYDQLQMDFTVAETYGVVSDLMKFETDVVSGVRHLLDHCNRLRPSSAWSEIGGLDFTGDSANLKRWLQGLLETEKPEENIVAFWFGLFDETGPDGGAFARLYLAGSESYDSDDSTSEWACSPAYFPDGRYADSGVLRSMSRILSTTAEEISWLGSYVLPLGYASLAVADACRQLQPDALLGRRTSRAVAVGFDSGDFITLPAITRQTPSI